MIENLTKNPLKKGFDPQNFSINSERQDKGLRRYVFHHSIWREMNYPAPKRKLLNKEMFLVLTE